MLTGANERSGGLACVVAIGFQFHGDSGDVVQHAGSQVAQNMSRPMLVQVVCYGVAVAQGSVGYSKHADCSVGMV